jgi:putative AlgH/UPF0301 family transcriptional regulator
MFENINAWSRPESMRMFAGFCHWGPGQLSWEVSGEPSQWLTAESLSPQAMFDTDESDMWATAARASAEQAVRSWL